jgi:hypothetical protein
MNNSFSKWETIFKILFSNLSRLAVSSLTSLGTCMSPFSFTHM